MIRARAIRGLTLVTQRQYDRGRWRSTWLLIRTRTSDGATCWRVPGWVVNRGVPVAGAGAALLCALAFVQPRFVDAALPALHGDRPTARAMRRAPGAAATTSRARSIPTDRRDHPPNGVGGEESDDPGVDRRQRLVLHLPRGGAPVTLFPFATDGRSRLQAFARIAELFRCRRTHSQRDIDPRLIRLLSSIVAATHGGPIELISGHRSPRVRGTRPTSQHVLGRAADIRVPGVDLRGLRRIAMDKGAGGVGFYPDDGFVHVDVRTVPTHWVQLGGGANHAWRPGTTDQLDAMMRRVGNSRPGQGVHRARDGHDDEPSEMGEPDEITETTEPDEPAAGPETPQATVRAAAAPVPSTAAPVPSAAAPVADAPVPAAPVTAAPVPAAPAPAAPVTAAQVPVAPVAAAPVPAAPSATPSPAVN